MKVILILLLYLINLNILIAQQVKIIQIKNNDIIYVPSKDRIYFTTPSGGINGNSICVMNPYFGTIEECYSIGSEPNKLALSNDGTLLYVGMNGAPEIVTFNIENKTVDLRFQLNTNQQNGPVFAEDIKVIPGLPNSIVVTRRSNFSSPRYQGVAVYDNGIMRPEITHNYNGSNTLTFVESTGDLYGYKTEYSDFGLRELVISPTGITEGVLYEEMISGYNVVLENEGQFIYSNIGDVIKAEDGGLSLHGRFAGPFGSSGIEVSRDSNVVFFATQPQNHPPSLITYDKTTFNKIDSIGLPFVSGRLSTLINWGSDAKLAFNTSEVIVLLHKCTSLILDTLVLSTDKAGGCVGDTVLISASDGYENYYWSNGVQEQSIRVSQEGQFYFYVADSLGCLSAPSNTIDVGFDMVHHPPYLPTNLKVDVCLGGTYNLNLSESHHFKSYLWSNGETTRDIEVKESGHYSVYGITEYGCKSHISNIVSITFLPDSIPDPPIIENLGNDTLCQGQNTVLSAPDGYDVYKWSHFSLNTQDITVTTQGNFTVQIGSHSSCLSAPSAPVFILVLFAPPKPAILVNGNTLASTSINGNQWFKNGIPIPDATYQFYEVTESGFYSVQVTINVCVSLMSELFNHTLVSSSEVEIGNKVLVFPNPASDIIYIRDENNAYDSFTSIEILDFSGKVVSTNSNCKQVSIGHLTNGLYFVRIVGSKNSFVISKPIIKV